MARLPGTTLANLVAEFGANAYIYADAGNGAGSPEDGSVRDYDEAAAAAYGDVELTKLDAPMLSTDGYEINYVSDWIEEGRPGEFRPANPYVYRIMF